MIKIWSSGWIWRLLARWGFVRIRHNGSKPVALPYTVLVDDNYHYMDESEWYTMGKYASFEAAILAW